MGSTETRITRYSKRISATCASFSMSGSSYSIKPGGGCSKPSSSSTSGSGSGTGTGVGTGVG